MLSVKSMLSFVSILMLVFIGCSDDDDNVIDEKSDNTTFSDYNDPYEQNRQLYLEYSNWVDSVFNDSIGKTSIGNTLLRSEFSYNFSDVDTDFELFGTCHVKNGRIISHEESPSVNGTAVPVYDKLIGLFIDFRDSWGGHISKDEPGNLWYGEITYDEFDGVKLPRTLVCYQSVEKSYGKSPYYKKYEITDIKLSK